MRVRVRSFWLPKAGNTRAEYEDAFYPRRDGEMSARQFRFGVADGASEGMLSGQWADLLTRLFCRAGVSLPVDDLLARAYQAWQDWTAAYLLRREKQKKPLQWFEEPGFRRGAFSSLLGLTLSGGESAGKWKALALGDSCLVQGRDTSVLAVFPVQHSADFGSRPFLIASNPVYNEGLMNYLAQSEGDWQTGDHFFLMTDALAQWFLRECEAERTPWDLLRQYALEDQLYRFEDRVGELRIEQQMRNDDVTLVCIEVL